MNRILFGVFALGLVFAVAQGLQCYNCDFGLFGACITKNITCPSNEHCYSGVGTAVSFIKYSMKGCLPVAECNRTFTETISSINFSNFTKTCCSTDLCNLAPRGAYGSFLSIALVTLTGAMITKALV